MDTQKETLKQSSQTHSAVDEYLEALPQLFLTRDQLLTIYNSALFKDPNYKGVTLYMNNNNLVTIKHKSN